MAHLSVHTLTCLLSLFSLTTAADNRDDFYYGSFPKDFIWGSATSSYQIEGGWDAEGKGVNIWDTFCHQGGKVANNENGDVACDSYNNWEQDIQLLKDMGVSHYRFSISWARVMPNGTGEVNQAGVAYYNKLIDGLVAANIQPMITLYHWDLPQDLQDHGGWANDTLIIPAFKEYARVCFTYFGDRAKMWLTFNEPYVFIWLGYGTAVHAPGINSDPGRLPYIVTHNVIRAHSHAWHLYDDEFRSTQKGVIGITLDSDWKEAYNSSDPEHVAAADRAMTFKLGWFANPIFGNGDYPELMKTTVAEKSRLQNMSESRLPEFTPEEKTFNKGTHDFFGLNHYTTQLMLPNNRPIDQPSYENDQDAEEYRDPSWPSTGSSWLKVVPWGMRRLITFVKNNYGNPPIYVTENGVSDKSGTLKDDDRTNYFRNYTNEMLKAIDLDGCNVKGYFAWSLMDNFEWSNGYGERFGLHKVDFNDPKRPRTAKDSAKFFKQLIKDNAYNKPNSGASKLLGSTFLSLITLLLLL